MNYSKKALIHLQIEVSVNNCLSVYHTVHLILIKRFINNFGDIFLRWTEVISVRLTSVDQVKDLIKELSPCSPGCSGISSKILKLILDTLVPILTKIINFSITTSSIPDDWSFSCTTILKQREMYGPQ